MINEFDRELEKYISKIIAEFPIYTKEERRFIQDLKRDIEDYMDNKGNCTINDIVITFGKPNAIVKEYIDNLNLKGVKKRVEEKQRRKKLLIALMAIMVVVFCIVMVKDYRDYQDGYTGVTNIEHSTLEHNRKD